MDRTLMLQQKLRKSQSLSQQAICKDFLNYAKEVSDEEEVYLYMQEHLIGIDQAEYWVRRMDIMRSQCKFVALVSLLNSLQQQPHIEEHNLFAKYERKLLKHLRGVVSINCVGKRRAADCSRAIQGVQQERRKIGNIQVYVDQSCRRYYELEDLADHVEKNMQDYCQVQREDYRRRQERKPKSFIAKKEQQLLDLAQEVMGKAARKSEQRRNSLAATRPSVRLPPTSNKFEVENFNTPKNNETTKPESTHTDNLRLKRKKDSSRDSIQILKSMKKERKEETEFKSPKFAEQHLPPYVSHQDPLPVEKCRSLPSNSQFFSFSFGKHCKSPVQERQVSQRDVQNKDNAFMFHSFSQDSKIFQKSSLNLVRKEDFELQLIIKQIQRQTYEKNDVKTFSSQIGSNQENQYFFSDCQQDAPNKQNRKPFQILLQAETKRLPPQQSINLQQLIDFDDEPQGRNPQEEAYGQEMFHSNHKKQQKAEFRSENKRFMSQISEQNSHFYSQSKNKYSRSK